jgi:hypothetical protein
MSARIRGVGGAVFPLAVFLVLATAVRGQNTNLTWTGGGGDNNWTNILNWNGATYPNDGQPMATSLYNATVNNGAPVLNTNITIENFTLGGGTVSGTGNLTLNALFTFTGGTLGGTGTTTLVYGSALYGGSLNSTITSQAGAVNNFVGVGSLQSASAAAVWNNQLSSTYNLLSDSGLSTFNGAAGTFNNSGIFQKTGGTGVSTIAWNFNNSSTGAVNVQTGTMNFTAGGTDSGGAYTVSGGATLEFNGTRNLNSTVSGAGTVLFGGAANVTLGGAANSFAPSGDTTVSGTVLFNSAASLNTLHFTSGQIDGSAALTVNGLMTWTSGFMGANSTTPGAGTTTLNAGAMLTGTGYLNRTMNNSSGSTVTLGSNSTTLYSVTSSAVFNNQAGSVFNLAADASVLANNVNLGYGTFNNAGTFQKTAGTGISTIQWFFNNTGAVNVQTGSLYLGNNGTDTGTYTVSSGAQLAFTGGTRNMNASLTGAGTVGFYGGNTIVGGPANAFAISGSTSVTAGGTATFNSPTSLNTLSIQLFGNNSGTVDGTAALTVNGLFTWSAGNMGAQTSPAAGTTTLNGGAAISGSPLLNRTLYNASGSTATFTGGGTLYFNSSSAIWNNQAGSTFNLASDGIMSGTGTFNNAGTFQKTAGTNGSYISCIFNNTGTINAQTGPIYFESTGTQSGSLSINNGATVQFFSGTSTWNGASSSGAGTLLFNGGTGIFNGTNNLASPVTLGVPYPGNPSTFDGSGALTISGPFTWTAGTMQGSGSTTLSGGAALSGGLNLNRSLTNAAGSTVTFNGSGTMYSFANTNWINSTGATFTLASDANLSVGNATGTFTNNGTFQKTGGTGTSTVAWNFTNNGTINGTTGTINFQGNGTQNGTITVGSGAIVQYAGGTNTWTGGASSGAGTLAVAGGTVLFNGTNTLASHFSLINGTIDGTGAATISGPLTWSGGFMGASSSPDAGTTTLSGGGTITGSPYVNRTVNNASGSTVAITNSSATLYAYTANAIWNNQAGSVFNLAADANVLLNNSNLVGTFNNAGTFQKTAGTSNSNVQWAFNNSGTVNIQTGNIYFTNSGTDTGTYSVTSAGTVGFTGGTRNLNAAVTGAGTIGFYGATVTIGGAANAFALTGNTNVTAGTVLVNSAASTNTLYQSGGIIDGTAAFTANGLFTWVGGYMGNFTSPSAGTTTLNGGASISGGTLNRTLTNTSGSTVSIISNGSLSAYSANAVWNNQAGATFTFASDGSVTNSVGTFNNAGTLQKTAGTGTSAIAWTFNNTGTVNAQTGTINFQYGGTQNATLTIATGATVNYSGIYSGSTTTWNGGTSSGAGTLLVNGGTQLFNGTDTLGSTVSFSGGTFDGSGSLIVNGPFNWSGGNMQGAGTTTLNGGGTFTAAFNLNRTVTNAAGSTVITNQSGSGGMYSLSANANWINAPGATYNFVNDGNLLLAGGTGTFTNNGLFEKTGGTGTSTVAWNFTNNGTLNATTGTINFTTIGTNTLNGPISVGAGATVQFSSPSTFTGGSSSGAGTLNFSSYTTFFNGTNTLASHVSISGGTIDGIGAMTISGPLTWSAGSIGAGSSPGAGTTTLSGGATLTNTLFMNRTVNNASGSTATFTNAGTFYSNSANAVWNNQAGSTFNLAADAALSINGGTGTFNNAGTFQKTAGTTSSTIQWFFNNSGTVNAQAGTLYIGNNGTDTGSYSVSGGAVLGFTGGTRALNAAVTGAGNLGFFGANVTVGGLASAYAMNGDTNVTAASVYFNSASSTGTLHQSAGIIDGSAVFTVNGLFTWTGGYMGNYTSPSTGTTTFNGGATISGSPYLNRGIINASGSVVSIFSNGTPSAYSSNASWNNQAGSTLTFASDGSLTGSGTFTNAGTIQKTAGTNTSILSWNFSNSGIVNVTTGTLSLSGTLSNISGTTLTGGAWQVVGPASGTTTLSFGSRDVQTLGTGTTVILQNANSAFTVNTSSAIDSRLTTLAAGSQLQVLNGRSYTVANPSNAFTDNGTLLVSSNAGASTFTIGAGINMTNFNAGTQTLTGGNWQVAGNATLNLGTRTITTIAAGTTVGLTMIGATAASFPALTGNLTTNNGTLQLLGSQNLTTPGSLTNTGTIQITGGGTLTVTGTFNDSGTVTGGTVVGNTQVSGGTFSPGTVTGNLNFTGAATIPAGASVSVSGTTTVYSGTTLTLGNGASLGGGGTVVVNNGGTLTVQGTVNQPTTVGGILNGNATFGNSLVIQSGGFIRPGNSPGTVAVTGNLTLNGEYDWDLNGNDNTMAGTTFDQVTATGTATLSSSQQLKVAIGAAVNFGNSFWLQSQTWPAIIANGGFTSPAVPGIGFDATPFQAVFPGGSFALAEQATVLNVVWTPGSVRQSTFAATGDGRWNNSANWNALPVSGPSTQLVFGPTAQPAAMTNDILGTFVLNAMTFTAGAPSYALTGNGLEFRTNAAGSTPQLVSNSSSPVTIGVPLTLTNGLTVGGSGNIALTAAIGGPGGLTMAGAGTLTLAAANTYAGGTNVISGTIAVPADAALGSGDIAGSSPGALAFTGTTTTSRSFVMNGGTISVAAGQTVTFNGGAVGGASFDGGGTFVANGARFVGVNIAPSVAVTSTNPADQFVHAVNSGAVGVAAGVNAAGTDSTINFNGFINQGVGSLTIGATSQVNMASFQSYGTTTVNAATVTENFSQTTLVTNLGTAPLGFNGGSRTFLGTPQTAVFPPNWPDPSLRGLPTFVAGIDLHGQNAVVANGLFVNNGYVEDSTNNFQGPGTIVADFGSLVKGAGYFQNTVQTINGGKFQAGNSPGKAIFGNFAFGPAGVSDYVFAIDDATGAAGPSPDVNGRVSGWGLVRVAAPTVTHGGPNTQCDFTWAATPADKLTVALETLVNPTTVGVDVPGMMDHFDPTRTYVWPAVEWTGSYAGPANVALLDAATTFDTSGFANPVAGTFGWSFDTSGHALSLTYTPSAVPEPGSLALASLAAALLGWRRARAAT